MPIVDRLSWAVATVLGIGHIRIGSGTVASLVAAMIWYWVYPEAWVQWMACVGITLLGLVCAQVHARRLGQKDPSQVVIDEIAGMGLALAGLPRHLGILVLAFFLFRFLDISKLPPIRQLERLPGGFGIMMDDVAAGLITRLLIAILLSQGIVG